MQVKISLSPVMKKLSARGERLPSVAVDLHVVASPSFKPAKATNSTFDLLSDSGELEGLPTSSRKGIIHGVVHLEYIPLRFTLHGVSDEDKLSVRLVSMKKVNVKLSRVNKNMVPGYSYAECPNGERGQPCVTCKGLNGTSIRICC